jgi:hypothetical protein
MAGNLPGYHSTWVERQIKADPLYHRKRALRRRYGMTAEEYDTMAAKQNHVCAICEKQRKLVVDHCHTTGAIRGLLCHACNNALHIIDSETLYNAALKYIGRN